MQHNNDDVAREVARVRGEPFVTVTATPQRDDTFIAAAYTTAAFDAQAIMRQWYATANPTMTLRTTG